MNLRKIKQAVLAGKTVHWVDDTCDVIRLHGRWRIVNRTDNAWLPLTWSDGITLIGHEEDFYIKQTEEERLRDELETTKHTLAGLLGEMRETERDSAAKARFTREKLAKLCEHLEECLRKSPQATVTD